MRLLDALFRRMPSRVLPRPTVPVGSVPMKLPITRLLFAPELMTIPLPGNPSMTRPSTVFPPEFSVSPSVPSKPGPGVITITGWVVAAPGWDCWLSPSMKTVCWTPSEEGLAIVRPAPTGIVHDPVAPS